VKAFSGPPRAGRRRTFRAYEHVGGTGENDAGTDDVFLPEVACGHGKYGALWELQLEMRKRVKARDGKNLPKTEARSCLLDASLPTRELN